MCAIYWKPQRKLGCYDMHYFNLFTCIECPGHVHSTSLFNFRYFSPHNFLTLSSLYLSPMVVCLSSSRNASFYPINMQPQNASIWNKGLWKYKNRYMAMHLIEGIGTNCTKPIKIWRRVKEKFTSKWTQSIAVVIQ